MPKLIGLCGYAGHGKTTAALHLATAHKFHIYSFAAPLKSMLETLLAEVGVNPSHINRMIRGDLKEKESRFLAGNTPRHAMQTLGTEWGRDCMGATFWAEIAKMRIDDAQIRGIDIVFDDVRFENEAELIRKMGGRIIQVLRPGAPIPPPGGHRSEHPPEPDMTCYNSGDPDAMRKWFDYHIKTPTPTQSR